MAVTDQRLMGMVLTALRILVVLNLVCLFFFVAVLASSFLAEGAIRQALLETRPAEDPDSTMAVLRIVMAIGIAVVPLVHVLLSRLKAIVHTVRSGDPFVATNADRLRVIAWCLLGIQVCDLGFGAVSLTLAAGTDALSGWTFSLTGWLAVALLFVLARVFAHGTRMRDDLEGTV
jgi:hypothetical protein